MQLFLGWTVSGEHRAAGTEATKRRCNVPGCMFEDVPHAAEIVAHCFELLVRVRKLASPRFQDLHQLSVIDSDGSEKLSASC